MKWLESAKGISQKTWNTLRAVGPFLLSQSDKASEAYQRHLGRVAEVDALRVLLKDEVETRTAIRRSLLERFFKAPPEERVRIEQDVEYLDGVMRYLGTVAKSLNYKGSNAPSGAQPNTENRSAIEDHWLDRFNELARKRNEDWRNELLARALAAETANPGSVTPRALWIIGNLEKQLFDAFSRILDMCIWSWPTGEPILPSATTQATNRTPHGYSDDSRWQVGHLVYLLADVGIIADVISSTQMVYSGRIWIVRYDQTAYRIEPKEDIKIRGVMFTSVGVSIAKFYEPQWNEKGRSVLSDWISFISQKANVEPFKLPSPKTDA